MIFKLKTQLPRFNLILLLLVFLPFTASAVEIVRMNVQIGAVQYDLDLELYDSITPITVANFLNYTTSNRFDKSFIHRSVTNFVIQGGGYTFDPFLGAFEHDPVNALYPGGLQEVPEDNAIINEFFGSGLSNVRGTIAMARTNDLDSARGQWFINQQDNLSLNTSGFTVFGQVLDDGIDVVDLMAAVPTFDLRSFHSAYGEIPLNNYVSGSTVTQDHLVRINAVTAIQRPVINSDTALIDFTFVPIGTRVQKTVILTNSGNTGLIMDSSSLATLVTPFNIIAETCSGSTLSPVSVTPTAACSITVEFAPVTAGDYQDNLVITPSVNPFLISNSYAITAVAIPLTPVLSVQNNISALDFSDVAINTISATKTITIQNRGSTPLNLSTVSISGVDAGDFSIDAGCSNTTSLITGDTCVLTVNFVPTTEGQKTGLLTIDSNAGQQNISLAGNGAGPEIELSTLSLDLGIVQINGTAGSFLTVKNLGLANLEITGVAITGADAADFTQENTCPSVNTLTAQTLGQNELCGFTITFAPTSTGVKQATLTINTTDLDESVINVSLTGSIGEADIDAVQQVNVGVAQISNISAFEEVIVTNLGNAFLDFTAVNITGVDSSSYSVVHDCPGTATTSGNLQLLGLNETCSINVRFSPITGGVHNARLEIASNDLDEPVFTIDLTGLGELDADGITDNEEQNSPNNGDANNDNEQDNVQNNVASFLTNQNVYASIVTDTKTLLAGVSLPLNPSPSDVPAAVDFKHGMFQYTIATTNPLEILLVYLPADDKSNTYYKYGPTPDNLTPHWYDFSFNGATGAQHLGIRQIENLADGSRVNRNIFRLFYADGQRGDDDLTVNGEVVSIGAVSFVSSSSGGGGGGGAISWYLIVLSAILLALSRISRATKPTRRLNNG